MKVAVLLGGVSSEREISIKSGRAVAAALGSSGVEVEEVDIKTETGEELDSLKCDVAFIALHGRFGEDGTIQSMLEEREIPYTGSGHSASRLAIDKISSKVIFSLSGVSTPDFTQVNHKIALEKIVEIINAFGMPVVIKPRKEGSSIGVTIHNSRETVMDGVKESFRFGQEAIIERFVQGVELTVGIIGETALPVVSPEPNRSFFDYYAKYLDKSTKYIVDPPIPEDQKKSAQEIALKAHKALGCEGFSRVDIISTDAKAYVLEVNTIPGLTERSLLPMAALSAGIDFPDLCLRIIEEALIKEHTRAA